MQENQFEKIKKINAEGYEFWFAREFAKVLGYEKFDNFINVIEKAKISCETSGQKSQEHIADASEMVDVGSGAQRESVFINKIKNLVRVYENKRKNVIIKLWN